MANAVRTKIERLSGQRTAKVKEIREFEAKLRKPGLSDAETKKINIKINALNDERKTIEDKYNSLSKLANNAEEYVKLNGELVKLQDSITRADARGEDTTSYNSQRTAAIARLKEISPDVENAFPEIKVQVPTAIPSSRSPIANRPVSGATGPTGIVSGTPTGTPSGTPTGTPAGKPTGTPAGTPTGTPAEKVLTPEEREAEGLGAAATATDFALPETLFKNIPSLNAILKKYVNTPGMTTAALLKEIRDDLWYKKNSKEIKERFIQYYNYQDLVTSGQAKGTTDYEMQIDKIVESLKKRAVKLGSAAGSDPAALRKAAENLYITNRSEDESFITDFLAASIRTTSGMIGGRVTEGYSGDALANYKLLVTAARDNGFQVSDIIPGGSNEQQTLQDIASGKIDINRVIADTRKLASAGQPTYVRDLLAQGYSLKQVFAPYRQVMANVLEIGDDDQIDLNDPLLRSAITEKGDMNLYDFRKSLRADSRWQYTEQARSDVSSSVLGVLRDFGFQG